MWEKQDETGKRPWAQVDITGKEIDLFCGGKNQILKFLAMLAATLIEM